MGKSSRNKRHRAGDDTVDVVMMLAVPRETDDEPAVVVVNYAKGIPRQDMIAVQAALTLTKCKDTHITTSEAFSEIKQLQKQKPIEQRILMLDGTRPVDRVARYRLLLTSAAFALMDEHHRNLPPGIDSGDPLLVMRVIGKAKALSDQLTPYSRDLWDGPITDILLLGTINPAAINKAYADAQKDVGGSS